jgi:TonB family protein
MRGSTGLPRYLPLLLAAVALVVACMLVSGALARRAVPGLPGEKTEGRVAGDAVELRERAEPGAPVRSTLARGARVTLEEDLGRWYRVETEDGARGFVRADGIERDTEREAREGRAKAVLAFKPVFGVVAEATDLLLGPYPAAARAGRLEDGTVVKIHAVDHAYFAIAHDREGLAYVRSVDVDLVPPDPRLPEIKAARMRDIKDLTVIEIPPAELTPGSAPGASASVPGEVAPPEDAIETEPAPAAGVVEEAKLLSRVDPVYPTTARRAGISGMVVLDVVVGADGRVTDVEVQRGLPLGLSEAAVEAVRRWQYRPAQGAAGPVASRKVVRIEFRLR